MQLSKRDKKALAAGGICLTLFCVFQFIVFPFMDNRARLDKAIDSKQRQLSEMETMVKQYQRLSQESNTVKLSLEKRSSEFSLFSFLEKNAAASQVKKHINYMRPSELEGSDLFKQSLVEMKLQAISITQLVSFLESIESSGNLVGVNRLSVQKNTKTNGMLDVILQIMSVDEIVQE